MPSIDRLLERSGQVAGRATLLGSGIRRHELDNELRRGHLTAPFPRVYCRPWFAEDVEVRERAAVLSVGPPAALSHLSALRRWGVPVDSAQVHVTVPAKRCPRPHDGLRVHRAARPPAWVPFDGVPTVLLAPALTQSWPLLPRRDQPGPVIVAVREGRVGLGALQAELDDEPRLPGRAGLARLLGMLAAGCESELELWGHLRVFSVAGLRHARPQRRIFAGGRWHRLDLGYEAERVAVEMDGSQYHSSRRQRERDQRRDAALSAVGWLTLRFSHQRLHEDVAGCRRDTLLTLRSRRP